MYMGPGQLVIKEESPFWWAEACLMSFALGEPVTIRVLCTHQIRPSPSGFDIASLAPEHRLEQNILVPSESIKWRVLYRTLMRQSARKRQSSIRFVCVVQKSDNQIVDFFPLETLDAMLEAADIRPDSRQI